MKKHRADAWDAITRAAEDAEIARALAEPAEEVDAGLRAHGLDPARVRADGAALGARLLADRERLAWQVEAAEALAKDEARTSPARGRYAALDHDALLARLALAKSNPRLSAPVAFMFRNHTPEEATDEELRGMLEDLDALADPDDE
jgi:hypothetical protein